MIEILEIKDLDTNRTIGYYSEDHVNKEEFVENVTDCIKETVDKEDLEFITLPTTDRVDYVWFKEVLSEDSSSELLDRYFIFSHIAKDGYKRMTRFYFLKS